MDEIELFIRKLNQLYWMYGCKLGSAANNVVRIDYTSSGVESEKETVLLVWDNEAQEYVRG